MDKLQSTAKKLNTLFRILHIFLKIAMVALLVGLVIIAAAFLFHLDPSTVGSGYNTVEIGCLVLELTDGSAPAESSVLLQTAAEIILVLIGVVFAHFCCRCVREILKPMTQGEPFHSTVSTNLKKLAKYSLILGLVANFIQILDAVLTVVCYDLTSVLLSEKITHITFNIPFDAEFLVVSAVLLLASYIFRYGEQLQQLSDETL